MISAAGRGGPQHSARIYEDAIGTVVADAVADKLSSSEDAFRQLLKLQRWHTLRATNRG